MRPMCIVILLVGLGFGMAGCSGGGETMEEDGPPVRTRTQKDSLLPTLPVPGARGVGRALDAAGAAAERARQHDTIR